MSDLPPDPPETQNSPPPNPPLGGKVTHEKGGLRGPRSSRQNLSAEEDIVRQVATAEVLIAR
ncbi:hypothetical protein PCANC_20753 [Puccinia coronata f. sp. avenae]|uniref:Uncharacterized protein n=1 Tax=Puccinia coronata f. sp. avenae TaxID=200324 RepID=A0A2N5U6P0_9BASI|nr:hypothetical protein PCANC_20753 [Puccinia coronata f. sp. avenae]